jgi:hypothetical protein
LKIEEEIIPVRTQKSEIKGLKTGKRRIGGMGLKPFPLSSKSIKTLK